MLSDAEVKKLYGSFEKKDMPFSEFRRKFRELTDPVKMARDLQSIKSGKN